MSLRVKNKKKSATVHTVINIGCVTMSSFVSERAGLVLDISSFESC